MKKTVVFDFDGAIHSYTSGWQGVTVIPDPVVHGIRETINLLVMDGYEVVIVSTRCVSFDGLVAVRQYLEDNDIYVHDVVAYKPPAICYIDDRAICFDGDPAKLLEKIEDFKPWNK